MMKKRIFEQSNGHLIITTFAEKARCLRDKNTGKVVFPHNVRINGRLPLVAVVEIDAIGYRVETDQELMDKCTQKLSHKDLPYCDIDKKDFPDRKYRNKWRMNADKKSIVIDGTLETIQEVVEAETNNLDTELAKSNPDPITVIKCQRNLEKLKQENWCARKKDTKEIVS